MDADDIPSTASPPATGHTGSGVVDSTHDVCMVDTYKNNNRDEEPPKRQCRG